MIGTVIDGKYRILSTLGAGGMGDVYKAEQLDARGQRLREVALKFIKPKLSRDPTLARRFLRELGIMARLDHPHTVTVYDSGETEAGDLYFTMKLIPGETLGDVLAREGRLPLERAVKIAAQVCEALAAAHEQAEPVVHRDLKPGNVFLEDQAGQEWVKVGDFGIAKVLSEEETLLTRVDSSLGTPPYMAPEQWPEYGRKKEVDGRTDLYALGVMLYEMLTGRRPFVGNDLELREQHLHAAPPPLPETIPENVRSLVKRLLAKNPNNRPANARAVKRVLERALAPPAPLPSPPPSSPPPHPGPVTPPPLTPVTDTLVKPLRRGRGRNVLWLGVIGVGLLLGGWLLLQMTNWMSALRVGHGETPDPKVAATPKLPVPQPTDLDTKASKDSSEMVLVPAGEFFMGCNEKVDSECFDNEKPGRTVNLPAFAIDKTEVTVAQFAQCVTAGKCSEKGLTMPYYGGKEQPDFAWACNWGKTGREDHPMNCVDWSQAKAFCEWAGKRLPSEAEWEKAARGTDGRKYSWANEGYGKAGKVANIADETAKREQSGWKTAEGYDDGFYGTSPVGSFPAGESPYHALDMIGNVWEWTADWYDKEQRYRSVRGGSWNDRPQYARASGRSGGEPGDRDGNLGFRCAQ